MINVTPSRSNGQGDFRSSLGDRSFVEIPAIEVATLKNKFLIELPFWCVSSEVFCDTYQHGIWIPFSG